MAMSLAQIQSCNPHNVDDITEHLLQSGHLQITLHILTHLILTPLRGRNYFSLGLWFPCCVKWK